MADQGAVIDPIKVARVCSPAIDPQRLSLKEVDTTESVYHRMLVEIADVALPNTMLPDIEQRGDEKLAEWSLFFVLNFREDMTPSGYGIGDLVNTISLLPNEELTLEVKTWETSKVQQDEDEKLEDRNSSDISTTRSNASELATENSEKTNEHMEAEASYSGFGAAAKVKGGYSQDVSNIEKSVTKTKRENSEKAASEFRATRQTKLAITRESGSESKSIRKIKNINQAQTLNVNFFSVLREYDVTYIRYTAGLVLLGGPVSMEASGGTYYHPVKGPTYQLRLGELIQLVSQPKMVPLLTKQTGANPVSIIREIWASWLVYLAEALKIPVNERENFIKSAQRFLRPFPGWMSVDGNGIHRWAYEVIPGTEEQLLKFLIDTAKENLSGYEPEATIDDVINILKGFQKEQRIDHWKITLPTPGLHADLSLGICSGAEDYFEAQRHYDLELKRLEVEKLRLQIEQAKIHNKQLEDGNAGVKIVAPSPTTSVSVGVTASEDIPNIEVEDN